VSPGGGGRGGRTNAGYGRSSRWGRREWWWAAVAPWVGLKEMERGGGGGRALRLSDPVLQMQLLHTPWHTNSKSWL
jgi:hypothetical protein